MGSSASKGARAAGSAVRKYPTRVPGNTGPASAAPKAPSSQPRRGPPPESTQPGSAQHTQRTEAVDLDGRDPGLAARLNTIGAVKTTPQFTLSPTADPQHNFPLDIPQDMMEPPPQSAFPEMRDNPALRVLEARQRIQEEADRDLEQMGRKGFQGRKYVDANTLQLALMRRKRGEPDARIEEAFNLKRGRLSVVHKGLVDAIHSV